MAREMRDEKAVKEDEKMRNPQMNNRHSQGREWGIGETARLPMHQAQVTAPREGTTEAEKLKELTKERRARRGTWTPSPENANCEETSRPKRERES